MLRSLLIAVLSLVPLSGAELQIDHVTLAGATLGRIRAAFEEAVQIPTEYGGRHANHATEMAMSSFPDGSYAELMAIQREAEDSAVAAHVWKRFLTDNAGPCAFALRVRDVSEEAKGLRAVHIPVSEPVRSGRTRPDGTRLEWSTTDVGPGLRGSFFPFLIQDITPRRTRVYLTGQPTTSAILGVSKVVIGVPDLASAVADYRRAFQLPAPREIVDREFEARLAWFENTPIVLAQGLTSSGWLTRRVERYGALPCAFLFGSKRKPVRARATQWFGSQVYWVDEHNFGWHLGIETNP